VLLRALVVTLEGRKENDDAAIDSDSTIVQEKRAGAYRYMVFNAFTGGSPLLQQ
jgi:hypothetical protein